MPALDRTGVLVYSDTDLENMWEELQHAQPNVKRTARVLDKICRRLLENVRHEMGEDTFSRGIIPVFILRGGLFFYSLFERAQSGSPYGIIIPHRANFVARPGIVYADIPTVEASDSYVLLDLIINTGATVIEVVEVIYNLHEEKVKGSLSIQLVAPFITNQALSDIKNKFPEIVVHTFWNNMIRGSDGWLIGLRFDAGDYACGGGVRLRKASK